MSLFLSNFTGKSQNIDQKTQASANGIRGEYSLGAKMAEAVRNMLPGQTISGEVVEIDGKDIQLLLDNNVVIRARLEQNMNLALGKILNFEVKSNTDGQVAIRPLFTNLSEDATILKALDEAELVPNEKALNMAKAMMEEGLPIDKKSLQFMYRQILNNPEVSASFLAQMKRLQIPFTPENIQQFQAYKNYEHQLSEGIKSVAGKLPEMLQSLLSEGKMQEAGELIKNILDCFTKEGLAKENNVEINSAVNRTANSAEALNVENSAAKEVLAEGEMVKAEANEIKQLLEENMTAKTERPDAVIKFLSTEERTMLADMLREFGVSEEKAQAVQNGEATVKEIFEMLKSFGESEYLDKEAWKKLLSSETFSKMIKEEVLRQWTLTPSEVPKDNNIEELYSRIREQAGRLLDAVASSVKPEGSLMKEVMNIRENVDFMHELNQVFTYVQLPLKMSNQNAHGELYVYTNKKNLAKKDGNVTALLHLDMEHLGSMDIFVSLNNEKVSTKFCLEKEEYLDFIESNMHLLNGRLEKRGYSVQSSQVVAKEEKTNIMEEILKQDKQNMIIGQQAFDVRA